MDVGPIHFVSLNCYGPTDEGSPQYDFLEKDLKQVDRSATPFVVLQSHCPFYSSNSNHHNEWQAVNMMAAMEPLFFK